MVQEPGRPCFCEGYEKGNSRQAVQDEKIHAVEFVKTT
jgi:hypothetical protein